ncbi:F-box/LRR-repeat protein 12-like [Mytilus trossulus]|uniref:F-box/LRR-repeat protein 12-like n=1 Tax=Mytilus trossulus TaxID=6551 RepID=UPI003003BB19
MANFDLLPDNIILEVLNYLPVKELCIAGSVCRRWRRITRDYTLWRHVDLTPYRLDLKKTWKVIRSHFSECLISLKLRGDFNMPIKDKNPVSDAMLADLNERCPNIRHITLQNCKLQNLEMKLPPSLTSIELYQCYWKPRWFKHLHTMVPNIKCLILEHTSRVDNHDLDDVCKITGLESLNLNACYRINEKGLEKIAKELINLQTLEIAHCNCTDLILHHISRHLTKLETLNIRNSKVTDSGISTIVSGLSNLKHLNINKCDLLTTSGLECLKSLKSLKTLVCDIAHITSMLETILENNGCIITALNPNKPGNI